MSWEDHLKSSIIFRLPFLTLHHMFYLSQHDVLIVFKTGVRPAMMLEVALSVMCCASNALMSPPAMKETAFFFILQDLVLHWTVKLQARQCFRHVLTVLI